MYMCLIDYTPNLTHKTFNDQNIEKCTSNENMKYYEISNLCFIKNDKILMKKYKQHAV